MSGMDMLFKSMGFDPAQIQAMGVQFQTTLQAFKDQLDRIEQKLDRVIADTDSVNATVSAQFQNEVVENETPSPTINGVNGHA